MPDTVNRPGQWSAAEFFRALTEQNRLASNLGFRFCRISGQQGFEEALQLPGAQNIVAVSDTSDGFVRIDNTPFVRSVHTVFMAMRHKVDDLDARQSCFDTMREIFRQFMSRLIREKVRIEQNNIYLDSRISFNEIDRWFFTGAAACWFTIAVDVNTDLRLRPDEWLPESDRVFSAQFTRQFS